MEKRVYTPATDRLRELHKNYGGAKSGGHGADIKYFDNCDTNHDTGNFYGTVDDTTLYTSMNYTPLSEQEFIDFMDLEPRKQDNVNSPSHYTQGGIECIEAIKSSLSNEGFRAYLKGNVQKYMWRYENKSNPVEDLKKAQWYLNRLIKEVEGD